MIVETMDFGKALEFLGRAKVVRRLVWESDQFIVAQIATKIDPENIDTAYKLSHDYEKRIKFQADIQDYVDMSISSTINLPEWGSKGNNETKVKDFAETLSKYAPRLRGFTCYPDGSRGGQPLTEVSYEEAMKHKGIVFDDHADTACKSGVCGI